MTLEIKFGYVQLAENKMMAVQWLVVMDVTRGIIGEYNIISYIISFFL